MKEAMLHVVHLLCVDKAKVEVPFKTAEGADEFAAWVGPFTGGHYRVTGRSTKPDVSVRSRNDDAVFDLIVKVGEAEASGSGLEAAEQAAAIMDPKGGA